MDREKDEAVLGEGLGAGGRISELLEQRGVSRRDFMKFCSMMAAALALPPSFGPKIAQALDEVQRPTLVWLEFQSCTGDTEALLRAESPTAAELVLDILSIDYAETIMAAAGHLAEANLDKVLKEKGINTLFLCGLSATGCVLATYHGALNNDYETFMLQGAIISSDEDLTKSVEKICQSVSLDTFNFMMKYLRD